VNLPGGEDVLDHATGDVYDYWQRAVAARDGSVPMLWRDAPVEIKVQWLRPMREFAERIALGTVVDAAETLSTYDGCQGGAYRAAMLRYAREELALEPDQLTQGIAP
jgi:hypothetical protein